MSGHILERDARHNYGCVNPDHKAEPCAGKIFKSVTTVIGKAVPKNLAWHGQTRGVIGVKGLLRIVKYPNVRAMKPGEILAACVSEGMNVDPRLSVTPAVRAMLSGVPKYNIAKMSAPDITDALKRERLTVNDHLKEAGKGGTIVHKALEDYANKGIIPSAAAVPESKRGSIRGLANFILEYRPEFLATEVKVLSVEHGFAGTFDLDAIVHAELYEVPKRGGGAYLKLRPHPSNRIRALVDMKNSKWVYPASHFPQLEAYEGGRLEMGMEPTQVRAVLWLNADGNMELVPSTSTFDDFLALKASAEVLTRLDSSWQRPRKGQKA